MSEATFAVSGASTFLRITNPVRSKRFNGSFSSHTDPKLRL